MAVDPRTLPVRWSRLRALEDSPAHYLQGLEEREPTPAMRFGSLTHRQVLGGAGVVVFEGDRRGNAWKDFKAAQPAGALIVTREEYDRSARCAEKLHAHPVAREVILGNFEKEVNWTLDGRACQSHIDAAGWTWVTELKTSTSAEPEWFLRHAREMGYHAQLAWYADALTSLGRPIAEAWLCVVEVQPPHDVTAFVLTPRALEEGRRLNRKWFDRLRACESANAWPGYVKEGAVPFDVAAPPTLIRLPDGEEIAA